MIKYTLPEYNALPPLPIESQVFHVYRENLQLDGYMTNENRSGTIRDICEWYMRVRGFFSHSLHKLHLKPVPDESIQSSYIYTISQLDNLCAQLGLTK